MAFTKETLAFLAKQVGMSVEDFTKNYAEEKEYEVELPAEPFRVFKDEESFNKYSENLKAPEYGRGVDDGKKNATEVFIKNIKEQEGLELTNSQLNAENLLTSLKSKYGGKNEELIAQFDKDKNGLLDKISTLESTYEQRLADEQRKLKQVSLKSESIQGIKAETKFDKFDGIDLIMKDVEVVKDAAGKEFIHYKGQQMRDENLEPLSMAEVTNNVFVDKGWYKDPTGRGGSNEHGGGGTTNTYKAFVKEMNEKGVHQGSATYNEELNKRLDDADFAKSVDEA